MRRLLVLLLPVCLLLACSGAAPSPATLSAPQVDLALPLRGVPDHAYDPAAVLLTIGGQPWCTGALLEEDVVITARRCVEIVPGNAACPAAAQLVGRDLGTIHVLVGDDVPRRSTAPRAVTSSCPRAARCAARISRCSCSTPPSTTSPPWSSAPRARRRATTSAPSRSVPARSSSAITFP